MGYNNYPWAHSSNRYYGQIVQESEASKFSAPNFELEKENLALKAKIEELEAQNRELKSYIENLKAHYALKPF